jgi:hypothetical protein
MFDPIIDVVTDGGTSNDTNFYIGDAPATITSLSPSSWTAGTSFTLTITGTGFGTSPTVSITDPNNAVSTGNFTSSPDGTTIQISVSVSASAPLGDVASVVVTPGGLINGAMGYQSCNCGSNSSTNGSAQAIAMIGPGNCFARLKYRPAFGGVASHSFWWVRRDRFRNPARRAISRRYGQRHHMV